MELPAEFLAQMQELLGTEYEAYLNSFQAVREYGLRVNTLKADPKDFARISPFALEPIPWIENGFFYTGSDRPGKHPYYFGGLYYLQEPSAMTPANRLPVQPGDRVLDLCAAPGGKSTELAAKLQGQGVLVSNDISNSRAKALLKNLELFGVQNAVIMSESPHKMAGQFPEYFDKILIDAPCSGEGMFRKEPSVVKSWIQNGTAFYEKLQREIVTYALQMLKPGGMLMYSTCTFNPGEDEGTVMYLLEQCPELKILPIEGYEGFCPGRPDVVEGGVPELKNCVRIFPHKMRGEGHFVALLQKGEPKADVSPKAEKQTGGYRKEIQSLDAFTEFMKDVSLPLDRSRILLRGEYVMYAPQGVPELKGLRILRSGLLLGTCKKNRFEPSQAFAMALRADAYAHSICLPVTDERVIRYLKGETLEVGDLVDHSLNGWQLVCAGNYPLGWAKGTGTSLKNKYLAGWRWQ